MNILEWFVVHYKNTSLNIVHVKSMISCKISICDETSISIFSPRVEKWFCRKHSIRSIVYIYVLCLIN